MLPERQPDSLTIGVRWEVGHACKRAAEGPANNKLALGHSHVLPSRCSSTPGIVGFRATFVSASEGSVIPELSHKSNKEIPPMDPHPHRAILLMFQPCTIEGVASVP